MIGLVSSNYVSHELRLCAKNKARQSKTKTRIFLWWVDKNNKITRQGRSGHLRKKGISQRRFDERKNKQLYRVKHYIEVSKLLFDVYLARGIFMIKYVHLNKPNIWPPSPVVCILTKEWRNQSNSGTLLIRSPCPFSAYVLYGWHFLSWVKRIIGKYKIKFCFIFKIKL